MVGLKALSVLEVVRHPEVVRDAATDVLRSVGSDESARADALGFVAETLAGVGDLGVEDLRALLPELDSAYSLGRLAEQLRAHDTPATRGLAEAFEQRAEQQRRPLQEQIDRLKGELEELKQREEIEQREPEQEEELEGVEMVQLPEALRRPPDDDEVDE